MLEKKNLSYLGMQRTRTTVQSSDLKVRVREVLTEFGQHQAFK